MNLDKSAMAPHSFVFGTSVCGIQTGTIRSGVAVSGLRRLWPWPPFFVVDVRRGKLSDIGGKKDIMFKYVL